VVAVTTEAPRMPVRGAFTGLAASHGVADVRAGVTRFSPRALSRVAGRRVPVLYRHVEPEIGEALLGFSDSEGLTVEGRLDLSREEARIVRLMMLTNEARALSIGFHSLLSHLEADVRVVDHLDVVEVSVVEVGADPLAVVREAT
jgi:hypothetical protein